MTKAKKAVTLIDTLFLALLILSASVPEALSSPLYVLSFLIPFAIGFKYSKSLRTEREEARGLAEELDSFFKLDKRKTPDILPLIAPSVALIFSLAALTSLFLGILGFTSSSYADAGFFEMVIIHAVTPAILEEMLFRYIPMKLILPYSRRSCVIISSFYFALIHADFFQMPYAFAAGVVFMVLDVAFDSVLPSMILHFVNNFLSVVWMKYCLDWESAVMFIVILAICSLLSCLFIVLRKKTYRTYISHAFCKGESFVPDSTPVILILMSFYIAIVKLFT